MIVFLIIDFFLKYSYYDLVDFYSLLLPEKFYL